MRKAWIIIALLVFAVIPHTANANCTIAAPTLTPSEDLKEGLATENRYFVFTIKNNDNANCSAATFTYRPLTTPGWTSTSNPSSITLTNGSNATVNITVTPERDIEDADYFTIPTFVHSANASINGTAKITFRVKQPADCSKNPHTIKIVDPSKSGPAGTTQSFQIEVNNTDSKCNSVEYNVSATPVDSSAADKFTTHHGGVRKVSAGQLATFTVTISSKTDVAPSSYRFKFEAKSLTRPVLSAEGVIAVSPTEAQKLVLSPGWNMVSSPTDQGITLDKIKEACGPQSALWYLDPMWGKYRQTNVMFPHLGYWIRSYAECSITTDTVINMSYVMTLWQSSDKNPEGKNLISANGNWPSLKGDCILREQHGGHYDLNVVTNGVRGTIVNLTTFEPKKGYRVKVNQSCNIQFREDKIKISSLSCSRASDSSVTVQFTVKNMLDVEILANSITAAVKQSSAVQTSLTHASILPQESKVVTQTLDSGSNRTALLGGYFIYDYNIAGQNIRMMTLCPRAGIEPV